MLESLPSSTVTIGTQLSTLVCSSRASLYRIATISIPFSVRNSSETKSYILGLGDLSKSFVGLVDDHRRGREEAGGGREVYNNCRQCWLASALLSFGIERAGAPTADRHKTSDYDSCRAVYTESVVNTNLQWSAAFKRLEAASS